jgi:hypothetical protein
MATQITLITPSKICGNLRNLRTLFPAFQPKRPSPASPRRPLITRIHNQWTIEPVFNKTQKNGGKI